MLAQPAGDWAYPTVHRHGEAHREPTPQVVRRIGLLSNKAMLGSVLLTFALQLAVIYLPPLQTVFKTTALSIGELLSCLLLSTVVFWAIEVKKLLWRR